MILYKRDGIHVVLNMLILQGSVFPKSMIVALPCAAICAGLRVLDNRLLFGSPGIFADEDSILSNNTVWAGLSFLVGFLIVFRTSQAHGRFWSGCNAMYRMRAEWFDACSSLCSFCFCSKCELSDIMGFQNMLIRLFSMMHAAALAEIEENNSKDRHHNDNNDAQAFTFELLDVSGIDMQSLHSVMKFHDKVELLFTWIQNLIMDALNKGILAAPPPIVSRAFNELANGMVAFHDAEQIASIPFPFPYAQTCDCLLIFQWLLMPFVVAKWCVWPAWAFFFCFCLIFITWSLNFIAVEIENPFGQDVNDLDTAYFQSKFNNQIKMLLKWEARRLPVLQEDAVHYEQDERARRPSEVDRMSFRQAWETVRGNMSEEDDDREPISDDQSSQPPERQCPCGNLLMHDSAFCRKCGCQWGVVPGEMPERKHSDCSDLSDAISQASQGNSMLAHAIVRQIRHAGHNHGDASPNKVDDANFFPEPRSRVNSDSSSQAARTRGQSDHSTGSGIGGVVTTRDRGASDHSNRSAPKRPPAPPTTKELADLRKTPPVPMPSVKEIDADDSPGHQRPQAQQSQAQDPAQDKPSSSDDLIGV